MSATAAIMLIGICGIVWGGFITLLFLMMRFESRKATSRERMAP